VVSDVYVHLQDPTGEAAAEAQKHLSLYELDMGSTMCSVGGDRQWCKHASFADLVKLHCGI